MNVINRSDNSNQVGEAPVGMKQVQKYLNTLKKSASYLTNKLCAKNT